VRGRLHLTEWPKPWAAQSRSFSDTPQFEIAGGRSILDGRRYHVATLPPFAERSSGMRERDPVGMKSATAVRPRPEHEALTVPGETSARAAISSRKLPISKQRNDLTSLVV
jgi:hypothetical protein